ncbi:MAG: LysR family transcriptional regulator [Anaerovoracaceae bacterium]
MLDNRIYTFLTLCQEMNYRKTAERLNMTQPAVTQHIHYLENQYRCKFFDYKGRKLTKTSACHSLEKHARALVSNDNSFRQSIDSRQIQKISIGATKTIGDYFLQEAVHHLLDNENIQLDLQVDNTEHLLAKLNSLDLDLLLVEGYFNKNDYAHKLIKRSKLVGICSLDHPFSGKEIGMRDFFDEHIILREEGSGTRAVLEQALHQQCFSIDSFGRKSFISSFKLIEESVAAGHGISFVYDTIANSNPNLGVFTVKGPEIFHEFNYVYLLGTNVNHIIDNLNL